MHLVHLLQLIMQLKKELPTESMVHIEAAKRNYCSLAKS
jgi:hypothetical protein